MGTARFQTISALVDVSDPLFKRFANSAVQVPDRYPGVSNLIHTCASATYGDPSHPLAFRLGNGGAGHTGVLRLLCEYFIASRGGGFCIEWVSNHSRHSQIALLGDVVQVALTYEPEYEDLSIREGWAKRMAKVFNDHFILVGPTSNPAGVVVDGRIADAMKAIAEYGSSCSSEHDSEIFQTRGDGSATFYKELALWKLAKVDLSPAKSWRVTMPETPYEALLNADLTGAYIITDRATYLTAKRDNALASTLPFVEGGPELLNPCSALVNIKAPHNALASEFASWLGTQEVQQMVAKYGQRWSVATPIFSTAEQQDIAFCICVGCLVPFLPELPRYLAKRGELGLAINNLAALRGIHPDDPELQQEMKDIEYIVEVEQREEGTWSDVFKDSGISGSTHVFIACIANAFQQLTGSNVMSSFGLGLCMALSAVFVRVKGNKSPSYGAAVMLYLYKTCFTSAG
ncbi:hypothetical protein KCU64_g779, partial [Aureobasidium melanogenum]